MTRLALIAIAAAGALLLLSGVYVKGRIDGEKLALAKVAQKNTEAANNADESRNRVDDCYRSGGVWDRTAGDCRRSMQGVPR